LKTKSIPATQQKPSPVNNYGDWGDGEAIAGSVAIWLTGRPQQWGRPIYWAIVVVVLDPGFDQSRTITPTCGLGALKGALQS
jgi:hypothetical protein